MMHLSNGVLSSDVTFNASCNTLMITEAVSELLHCICKKFVHLPLLLIFCFLEQLLIVPLLSHIKDLEGKIIVDELRQEVISTNSKAEPPQCLCLAWSADGQVQLFSPYLAVPLLVNFSVKPQ